jgi:hypothetical protein
LFEPFGVVEDLPGDAFFYQALKPDVSLLRLKLHDLKDLVDFRADIKRSFIQLKIVIFHARHV